MNCLLKITVCRKLDSDDFFTSVVSTARKKTVEKQRIRKRVLHPVARVNHPYSLDSERFWDLQVKEILP
jgi:hypothetical protein